MKKCLITGVCGFIGRRLWDVAGKSRGLELFGADIAAERKGIVFPCRLDKRTEVRNLLRTLQPRLIIHLAGGGHPDPWTVYKKNFVTAQTLMEESLTLGIRPRIILIGSAAEYGLLGPGRAAFREASQLRPSTWYGYVKSMQTALGRAYVRKGLDVLTARLFNICGSGLPESLVLGRAAAQIAEIEKKGCPPFVRLGPLGGQRDFLDVDDVCSALLSLGRRGKAGEIYNVCRGRSVTARTAVRKMIQLSHVPRIVLEEEEGTPLHSRGSGAKIFRVTGWSPRVSLEQSLRKTLDYYRHSKKAR